MKALVIFLILFLSACETVVDSESIKDDIRNDLELESRLLYEYAYYKGQYDILVNNKPSIEWDKETEVYEWISSPWEDETITSFDPIEDFCMFGCIW